MFVEFSGKHPTVGAGTFIAPTAVIVGDAVIGEQSNLWFGAVVRADYGPIRIGSGCSIQDNVVVHVNHTAAGDVFPTVIEDNCIIGHGAVVEGCHIGEGSLIGMNAVVLPGAHIGRGSIVAAGSVVKAGDSIPEHTLVAGAPAAIKKTFTAPNKDTAWAVDEYRALAARYDAQSTGSVILSERT